MRIEDVSVEMRVLVARGLSPDLSAEVGRTGTVVRISRRWAEVVLDGESVSVPFRAEELDPLRATQSDENPLPYSDPRV